MGNKVVSLLIVIIGAILGIGVDEICNGHAGFTLGWATFFIFLLLAFLNAKKNFFKI